MVVICLNTKLTDIRKDLKFKNLILCFEINAILWFSYILQCKFFISNSNGETTKKQRGFQLYKLGDFRVRGHQLSKERCCGTISDLVRKLTIDINGKDEVGA